ncbi:MAG: hypothetical protein WCL08_00100 [Verrucomicrobiota bacterium]
MGFIAAGVGTAAVGVGGALLGYFLTDKSTPKFDQKSAKKDLNSYMSNTLPLWQNLEYDPVDVAETGQQALDFNMRNQGNFNQIASGFNESALSDRMKMLQTVSPAFTEQRDLAAKNNTALLKGEIPMDVQQQMARSNAYNTYKSGYSGSPSARSGTLARDLGLTSLGLQQIGSRDSQAWLKTNSDIAMPQQTYGSQVMQQLGMTAGLTTGAALQNAQSELGADMASATGQERAYSTQLSTKLQLLSQKLADETGQQNANNQATKGLVSGVTSSLSSGIGAYMGGMSGGAANSGASSIFG